MFNQAISFAHCFASLVVKVVHTKFLQIYSMARQDGARYAGYDDQLVTTMLLHVFIACSSSCSTCVGSTVSCPLHGTGTHLLHHFVFLDYL